MHGHQGCPSSFAHTRAPAFNVHVELLKEVKQQRHIEVMQYIDQDHLVTAPMIGIPLNTPQTTAASY